MALSRQVESGQHACCQPFFHLISHLHHRLQTSDSLSLRFFLSSVCQQEGKESCTVGETRGKVQAGIHQQTASDVARTAVIL